MFSFPIFSQLEKKKMRGEPILFRIHFHCNKGSGFGKVMRGGIKEKIILSNMCKDVHF